ncbi:ATP-binding protein [Streptomyces sp. B6B3]|uniref:ATP-binding protein n=1 Tax=Streptomyces sp. B6B3 TaxID=3153570 RepID=UPI00325EA5E6
MTTAALTGLPEVRTYRFITLNTPDAPKLSREHVAWLVTYNACPVELDTAKLLVSEVVTNAHEHTGSALVCLTTTIRPTGLRVAVYDTDPHHLPSPPHDPPLLPTAERGRGLLLLQTCASSWGYNLHGGAHPSGKTVWFALTT